MGPILSVHSEYHRRLMIGQAGHCCVVQWMPPPPAATGSILTADCAQAPWSNCRATLRNKASRGGCRAWRASRGPCMWRSSLTGWLRRAPQTSPITPEHCTKYDVLVSFLRGTEIFFPASSAQEVERPAKKCISSRFSTQCDSNFIQRAGLFFDQQAAYHTPPWAGSALQHSGPAPLFWRFVWCIHPFPRRLTARPAPTRRGRRAAVRPSGTRARKTRGSMPCRRCQSRAARDPG